MKFNPNYTITIEIAKFLVQIEEHKDTFRKKPLTAKLLTSLRKSARLISTHYSTQIEGNRLSMEQVEQVVKRKSGFANRERDEIEVANYYKALEYIEKIQKEDFSEKIIKTIHGLVMKGTTKLSPYREGQNVIRDGLSGSIVYMPPEAKDVNPLMENLVLWINSEIKNGKIPIPIIASLAHYQIATIHPYYDGNGRTARLITTFLLHRYGYGLKGIYSLEEYYANNITGYYDALAVDNIPNYYMGRAEADITGFISYFMEAMANSFSKINIHANEQSTTISKVDTSIIRDLDVQQRAVLTLFVDFRKVSSQLIADHLGVKKRSATYLIKKWLESGFLEIENPSFKSRTYKLNQDLEKHIE